MLSRGHAKIEIINTAKYTGTSRVYRVLDFLTVHAIVQYRTDMSKNVF